MKPKLAVVWWADAHHAGSLEFDADEVPAKHKPMMLITVGWAVKSDRAGVTLARTHQRKEDNPTFNSYEFRGQEFIDRRMIKRVEYPRREK